ncbi:MAG: Ppx/GppA family phosphatase [Ignavibacteriales bacterium]|jgi:exopolyphosphatase/guanosine-5'-triphosphate,3'-diphosphate pyrophosphatase|nr:MAG: Ppx/GppA family phosphatase [Ignavibacteriales bacterium]
MNIASIDIGSNTVLLLIAEVDVKNRTLNSILNEYEAPRLGKGLKDDGSISLEAIKKLETVLHKYKILIEQYNCTKVICTATNAMRVAQNSSQIIIDIKDNLGIEIDVIDGDREAELTFLGASTVLNDVDQKIVVDIGGGSTEVIFGNKEKILYKKSFPIGAVNTTERFIHGNVPTASEINSLTEFVNNTFNELNRLGTRNIPLIAVAGTPTSLSAVNLGISEYDENLVEGSVLTDEIIEKYIQYFSDHTAEQILLKYGKFLKGREDIILAGSIILKTVMKHTHNKQILVSGKGIRYGSIISYMNNYESGKKGI